MLDQNYLSCYSGNKPTYNRQNLQSKIAHIGFGAFHRAHQALVTDRLMNQLHSPQWGICELNLMGSDDLIQDVKKQDYLYSVLEKGEQQKELFIIGSVAEAMSVNLEGAEAVLEKLASPEIEIVTLTITEKGYCVSPESKKLDLSHPFIQYDLKHPQAPKSAIGYLVEALHRRKERNISSFTALSCDNIPANGKMLKQAVIELAHTRDPELALWIEKSTAFPCSMVDRIVPAITAETTAEINALLQTEDLCGISCEPFLQWVIEDNFVQQKPAWDLVGAEFVSDVTPYEEMKLRMLNGSHSFLAYLGSLAGYQYINECMQNPSFKQATLQLMLKEQAPTLTMPEGTDLTAYANKLIQRFANPQLQHKTIQIAMDGSQKLPQRILESIQWHIKHHSDHSLLTLAVAAWMRFVNGIDDNHHEMAVQDVMLEQIKNAVNQSQEGESRVNALLSISSIFSKELAQNADFVRDLCAQYESLIKFGAKETLINVLQKIVN